MRSISPPVYLRIIGSFCFQLAPILLIAGIFVSPAVRSQSGEKLYQQYCAACHGRKLEGAMATKLVKTDWKYGRHKGDFVRNIRFGIPNTDMRPWKNVLTNTEVDALAEYIIRSQQTPPQAERPLPSKLVTQEYIITVLPVVDSGLTSPWAIEFIDRHRALIAERPGRIRWLTDGILDPVPVHGTPPTRDINTGGYMDIALDPKYHSNGWIYLAYSHFLGNPPADHSPGMTRIVRGKIKGHAWVDQQVLFEGKHNLMVRDGNRWGCRFIFDNRDRLYFSIGDMGNAANAQRLDRPEGKIFRINSDGSIPLDNPFIDSSNALHAIYTLGNRNVQGFDFNPQTGNLWASEHGPMGGDELNIIKKGKNYGWPIITYGIDYSGDTISRISHSAGMEQPVTQWSPSIAPCPILFVKPGPFTKWINNLMVGALSFEEVRRLVIKDEKVISQEVILKNQGRVRDIKNGPDGTLYLLLNNPDKLIRLQPAP